MSFCKFSPNYNSNNKITIDVAFINDFLPKAPDLCVKAYLLGLAKCNNADDQDNSLEYFCQALKVCEDDVVSLFKYWEDLGLCQVLSTNPIEVRYLPVMSTGASIKKFQVDKYADFNIQIQELLSGRMIMPNEFQEFYYLIESKHMQQNAIITIVKYCVDMKGFGLSPHYCLAVAKDWESMGIRTLEQVEEKIMELGLVDDDMTRIISAMGSKRKVQLEDKELLTKWKNSLGFTIETILEIVKLQKTKKRRLDVNVLDELLMRYYEMKLMSTKEILTYEQEKENLFSIAIAVNKELGVYYEDLSKEVDTYVLAWVNMGYDVELLKIVADNCFKSSIKTLEGFNSVVQKLFKLGIVNLDSYMNYIHDALAVDEKIKQILLALNLSRNVNNMDRNFYRVWTQDWKFDLDVILFGATLAKDKANSINYLNKILSNWNSQGIRTVEQAGKTKVEQTDNSFIHNNYTQEQISSLISNLDEVEV